jgi:hypothetical protein
MSKIQRTTALGLLGVALLVLVISISHSLATYQVQLQAVAASHCGGGPCYEALLLDAAPDALLGE